METQNTFGQFVEILSEVAGVDPESVRPDQTLGEDLDIDSLSMVEILISVEDRFGVVVPEETGRELRTVGEMVAHLEKAVLPA